MAIKAILRMGDPKLLRIAEPVTEFDTPELRQLITDLWDTMKAANGAGLAAPQIGVDLRVVVFGCQNNPRYQHYADANDVPERVLINPVITPLSQLKNEGWEGCLSVPGMRGQVSRFQQIRYSGYDDKGEFFSVEAQHFHARVVQHECDHLDGILYPMKINDMTRFGFIEELASQMGD
ncbi:MAG: peptide deformylase [Kangiellaceae bacterium]|jgi:peptide deformylase|nr:peptide deformylase [Kangiellaceae bacterium]|tara:strand:+ start:3810 stop:4343 length:534 start_codon:yes stop_codon:yes gene_type:complete